jgi:hypothetical protein
MSHQTLPPRFEQLPFVGDPQSSPAPNWVLPAVGGYETGYATGAQMAHAFLDFMCRGLHPGQYPFYLSRIILSFYVRIDAEGGLSALDAAQRSVQLESLRGQFFGFFNTISAELAGNADRSDILGEEDWLTEVDMAGSCPSLERIHVILDQVAAEYRRARPTARMFWFLFGMYQGRLLHEKLTTVEPEAFGCFLSEL